MARNKTFTETGGKQKPEALSFNNAATSKETQEDVKEGIVVSEIEEDVFEQLKNPKKKIDTTVLKGYKIERDLAKLIDKLGKQIGRGGNSKLVNQLLREGLKKRGYLD